VVLVVVVVDVGGEGGRGVEVSGGEIWCVGQLRLKQLLKKTTGWTDSLAISARRRPAQCMARFHHCRRTPTQSLHVLAYSALSRPGENK